MLRRQKRNNYIDNLYLEKRMDSQYRAMCDGILDCILEDDSLTAFDKSAAANLAMEACLKGMEEKKPVSQAMPGDAKRYAVRFSGGPSLREMKKKLCSQDYEKFIISSIWTVFTVSIVLFFISNLIHSRFFLNYWIEALVACLAGGVALQNYMMKRRIAKRHHLSSFYLRMDAAALAACVFIKIVSQTNFDVSYLILVISFYMTKKRAAPEFEAVMEKLKRG